MRVSLVIAACTALLGSAAPAAAVDFDKVDRRIAREPAYRSQPLYCLALIGPDAKTRVWMVLDGERLFVDKNCNGDLTDDGPPAEIKENTNPVAFDKIDVSPDRGKTVYQVEVTLWNRPSVVRGSPSPDGEPYNQSVHITFPDGRRFGAWGDHDKPLMFAAKPRDAPALHFGGDLRMGFEIRKPLERVAGGFKLSACVGTPGSCPGAWVHLMYKTIPKDLHPNVVMEFPPASPNGPPVRVEFVLGERC